MKNDQENQDLYTNTNSVTPTSAKLEVKKKRFSPIILVVVLLLVAAGAGVWMYLNSQKESSDTNTSSSPTTAKKDSGDIKFSVIEEGKLVLPNGHADPTIAATNTGYRMYANRQSGGPGGYLTFTSTDGVTWTKEKDIIISGVATGRAVVLPNGVRFYYPGAQPIRPTDPPAEMFSSFSTDGVNFTREPGVILKPRSGYYVEGPTVFQLSDKSWRMYFNENTVASGNQRDGEIWGAKSTDGVTWTRDEKVTLQYDETEKKSLTNMGTVWPQVLHPFVVINPKGGYIMFYNSHSEVFAAFSKDGLTWKKLGKVGIHGADVDGYFQKDGTFRMFYGDFKPDTGGLVYSAVLKIEQ